MSVEITSRDKLAVDITQPQRNLPSTLHHRTVAYGKKVL
jgi:hypothetical protein